MSFIIPSGGNNTAREKRKKRKEKIMTSVGDLKDPDVNQNILSGGKKRIGKKKNGKEVKTSIFV